VRCCEPYNNCVHLLVNTLENCKHLIPRSLVGKTIGQKICLQGLCVGRTRRSNGIFETAWETVQWMERDTLTNWRNNWSIESISRLLKISCSWRPPWHAIHCCNLTKFCTIHYKIAPVFVTIPTAVLNFQFLVAAWTSNIHFTLQALRWRKSLGLLSSVNLTVKEVAKLWIRPYSKKSLVFPCHAVPFTALLVPHISSPLPHSSELRNPKRLQRIAVASWLLMVAYLVEISSCYTE
jgi:hypothetical protein